MVRPQRAAFSEATARKRHGRGKQSATPPFFLKCQTSFAMLSLIPFQAAIFRLTLAGFVAAPLVVSGIRAQPGGGEEAATPPAAAPRPDALSAQRRALREFDRFLDHHPLLEDQLRLQPRLIADGDFLAKNSDLRDFLHENPNTADGLKSYPRYFLNRALLRQASAPLSFADLACLKPLFLQQPPLEQSLTRNPELIRDPTFLNSHAALRDCLLQHPALARVFLNPTLSLEFK
jgi:hypothetical protein